MKNKMPRYAGILSVILAVVLLVLIYALLGTVDLVFVNDGKEVCRQENVSVFSDIEVDVGSAEDPIQYTYLSGDEVKPLEGNETNFRIKIATTLVENLFTFKWNENDQVITLTAE